MTDQPRNENFCPFWDKYGKRECRLVESGLFIPTREHILRFCENELYVKCYHYIGRPELFENIVEKWERQSLRNRRQFTRIPTREKLSVSRYSLAFEENEDIIDDKAIVVDLSLGGMRIETDALINVNQIVSFSFDEKFYPPVFKGKGEVRWILRPNEHKDGAANAGLAFVDDDTKNIVKNHLLGMGEKLLRLNGF